MKHLVKKLAGLASAVAVLTVPVAVTSLSRSPMEISWVAASTIINTQYFNDAANDNAPSTIYSPLLGASRNR